MIYTNSDGGARGNPGPAAIGIVIRKDNKILKRYGKNIGRATNNIAEYMALIKALELASKYTKGDITCVLDSELIVKQLLGKYKVKDEKLRKLFCKVQHLQERFGKIKYLRVSRWNRFQKIADYLLNRELDKGFRRRFYK